MKTTQSSNLPERKLRNFLFVSRWASCLDAAYAIKEEGHHVRLEIIDEDSRDVGDGCVEKVSSWSDHTDWADIIIFDYTGFGNEARELRARGKKVIGGTPYTDRLELDRSFGQEELRRHGVKILQYREFTSIEDAIEYVSSHPDRYVIKPGGELMDYKQLLFVGNEEDGSDIIRVLRAYQKTWGNAMEAFQLQKRVSGVEISVAAFFNGHRFIKPVNITFEHKKLFPRELGVSTGEMGTSMFWDVSNPIFDATLQRMESTLAQEGFVGHIDINTIVNGNGIYPLEFTCRFGYPQLAIQRAGIQEGLGECFYRIASGEDFVIKTHKGFQVGVVVAMPPFPYEDPKTFESFSRDAVVVFKKPMKEGIHPIHLKMENREWMMAGMTGEAMVVTGLGTTMKDAQKMAYNRIANIMMPNAYWRTDIGDRWSEDSDRLWTWDYL